MRPESHGWHVSTPQRMGRLVRLLGAGLHGRSRWRLPLLMMASLFAGGRRVVAAWIRTAGLSDDYQDYYYFLQSVGRCWRELGRRVLVLVLRQVLGKQPRVLVAIDDSPTKRYGPKVQGPGFITTRRRVRPGTRSATDTSG